MIAAAKRRVAAALPFALLGAFVVLMPVTGHDDKYISYWVAERLAETGRIVNYNGERVEQSVALLQIVLLAIARATTRLDVQTLAWVLSLGAGLGVVALGGRVARALDPRAECSARWLVACLPPLALWTFSGTEMTLACFTLLAALVACASYLDSGRRLALAVLALIASELSRPESAPIWFAALVLAFFSLRKQRTLARRVLVLAGVTLASAATLALCRYAYFGRPWPQPVYGKAGGYADVVLGLRTLFRSDMWKIGAPLWALGALYVGARALLRREVTPALVGGLALAELGFSLAIGADVFLGARFLLPAAVLVCIWMAFDLAGRILERRAVIAAACAEIVVSVLYARGPAPSWPLFTTPHFENPSLEAAFERGSWFERKNRPHTRDLVFFPDLKRAVSEALRDQRQIVVSSGNAGLLTSRLVDAFPGRIRFVDRNGLTTRDWESCRNDWERCPKSDIEFGFFERAPEGRSIEVPRPDYRLEDDWLRRGNPPLPQQMLILKR